MTTDRLRDLVEGAAAKVFEPAESDPGPGWLRSKVLGLPWPRPGHEMPCGRSVCPICAQREQRCDGVDRLGAEAKPK